MGLLFMGVVLIGIWGMFFGGILGLLFQKESDGIPKPKKRRKYRSVPSQDIPRAITYHRDLLFNSLAPVGQDRKSPPSGEESRANQDVLRG
jgi:hypothetical protein